MSNWSNKTSNMVLWRFYPTQMLAYWWADWIESWRRLGLYAAMGGLGDPGDEDRS